MKCRYFCRLPLDISPVYLTRGISFKPVCYRLCVFASGSMITDIFICCTLIRVSCLHFGQYRGKFFSSVSFRIFNLVLLWHMGHIIHSLFILNAPIPANHLQLYHMRINFACVHQFFWRSLFGNGTV